MRNLLLLVAIVTGCASSPPPPTANPTNPNPGAGCPSDIATLVGQPCTTEGAHCGSASGSGFSNIVTCKAGTWAQVEVPPPPPGGLACGSTTCSGSDICIATSYSGGAAPPPGEPPRSGTSYQCAAQAQPVGDGGLLCGEVKDRRQSCTALLP